MARWQSLMKLGVCALVRKCKYTPAIAFLGQEQAQSNEEVISSFIIKSKSQLLILSKQASHCLHWINKILGYKIYSY